MKQHMKKILSAGLLLAILMTGIPSVYAEEAVYSGDIRWDFVTDTEGFLPKDEKSVIEATADGTIKVTNSGDTDPNIYVEGLKIDPNVHKYMRFRMKNNSNSWKGEAYIYTDNLKNRILLSGFNIDNHSTEWKEYSVPIDYSVMHAGTAQEYYTGFRLDYMNGNDSGNVEIDYIMFSKYDAPVTESVIESVGIGGKKVEEFNSSGDYCETDIYDDIYADLSADDVSVFLDDKYSTADIQIAVKNVIDRKIIDITAVYGDMIRSYRIVCRAVKSLAFITIDECLIKGKFISVSGYVKDEDGNAVQRPVTIIGYKKGNVITTDTIKYMRVLMPDSEGKFSRVIKINDSETMAEQYTMEILLDVMGALEPVTADVLYINNTRRDESLAEMKESSLDVFEFMTEKDNESIYSGMGVWIDLYNQQTGAVKGKMNTAVSGYRQSLTIDNTAEIANGTILAVLAEAGDMLDVITEFDEKVKAVKIQDTQFSDLEDSSRRWVAENVSKNKDFETYEEFYNSIRESMLLDMVNNTVYMELCDLLLDNTDVLNNDMSKLKKQTNDDIIDEAMRNVALKAKSEEFTSVTELIAAVDEALDTASKAVNNKPASQGGSNSGGNGSSGGGSVSQYVASGEVKTDNTENNDTEQSNNDAFNDLDGYEWAEPAIVKLNILGIVSGTGNGEFEPDREVTREEFVKLMCEAFNIDTSGAESSFADVNEDDWFFGYVTGAVEAGIVTGISEDAFGTGMKISREDMTVIMYRALKEAGCNMENVQNEFDDKNMISDYAEEAVGAIAAQGIINGVGNNMFAPKEAATRAEAAVIILRCMEKFAL